MKVFVTRRFPHDAIESIKQAGFSVDIWDSDEQVDYQYMTEHSKDVDGLLCTLSDKIDEQFINSTKNLKLIVTMSVGFDHIDTEAAKKKNIKIGYTPGDLGDAIAELAIGLLLTVSRRLLEGMNAVKHGGWTTWKPFWLCGVELRNSVVGVVGFGNIGRGIAKRAHAFNVKSVIASDKPGGPTEIEIEPNVVVHIVPFEELLEKADFIIVACTLNEKTRNLFNDAAFAKMKKNAILVNISRGPVIDQDALLKALTEKRIAGAGLDVCYPEPLPTDHDLLKLPNCIILPHLGSATIETRNVMCQVAIENLIKGLQGVEMPSELKL